MSVSLVARRHDVNANLLFAWRRQARQEAVGVPAGDAVGFVPVEVTVEQRALAAPAMIEVAMADAVIRVPCGADATTLAAVVSAVRGRR